MSTIPPDREGQRIFEDLVRNRVVLMPLNNRGEEEWTWDVPKRTKKRNVQIFAFDIAAGDDKYLFFTPSHPLHDDYQSSSRPAIAFDAQDLIIRATSPGFRPRDLEGHYKYAMRMLNVDDDEEENVYSIEEELSAIAEILTRSGKKPVTELIRLYNDLVFHLFDDKDRPQIGRPTYPRDLMKELDQIIQPDTHADTVTWLLNDRDIDIDPGDEWVRAAETWTNKYPYIAAQPPEVVIDAPVPLGIGLFYRDIEGKWHPMNKLQGAVSEMRANAGSQVMFVSPSEHHLELDATHRTR